jgi:hypothetical protein
MLALSAILFGWSAATKSSVERLRLTLPTAPAEGTARTATQNATAISPAELQSKLDERLRRLVQSRDEFNTLLAEIEAEARRRGWSLEIDLEHPQPAPFGLRDLTLQNAAAELRPLASRSSTDFGQLMDWLDRVSALPRHAEIAGLRLLGDSTGMTRIRVELHVLGRYKHEEAAPE